MENSTKSHALLFLGLVFCFTVFGNNQIEIQKPSLYLVYDTPATAWENEALPIGNGYMGAMLFGGVESDLIQINEHTLWSGGPGANSSYDGGHTRTAAQNKQNLQNARNALQKKMNEFTSGKSAYIDEKGKIITHDYSAEDAQLKSYINGLMGTKTYFGSYQSLGNIHIAYPDAIQPEIIQIETDCESSSTGETTKMLFDGNFNTKWFSDKGFKQFPCYINWEYDKSFAISGYSLVSGNDMPERDPKAWILYGSEDGKDYTIIDSQNNVSFTGRNQQKQFKLTQKVSYRFFKLEIITINNPTGNAPQLSEIILENDEASKPVYSGYKRILNIDNALASVSYTEDGVAYTREYFMSYPHNVFVIKLSVDKPGKLSRVFRLSTPQEKGTILAENNELILTGSPADHSATGLKFAQKVKVIPSNGNVIIEGNKLVVNNADEIILLMSAATNYVQCMDESFTYFSTTDPLSKVTQQINNASTKSYNTLLEEHTQDYKSLYDRMAVSFGNIPVPNKSTDKLLEEYGKTNSITEDRYLEMLYYQFGRYLLIASSRENTLPANLQGIWADGLNPPWSADYHTNINLQMNYWPVQQTNLRECHLPVIEYVRSLVPRGKQTAQRYYCKQDGSDVRGWVIHHENNIWGNTAPGNWYEGFYFPAAAAWMCQDIWEYYQFNSDKQFLEDHFNIMLDAALFWVDNLWRDERDGSLVANPSYSPEHGNYSLGASADQAIIWELFDFVLKASQILEKKSSEIDEIKLAKKKLAGPQIGLGGQFMEWKDEITRDITGDAGHRHVNHLFWLHPGSQIVAGRSLQEERYIDAMRKTLLTRGDGGTGWSKAWKINFWARLRDGDHAHKMVEEILKESTLENLFDTHPPFQIDGNFGSTAGMTEMLIQSQGDCIEILPALPQAWNTGTFKGIKARGNFELNAQWSNGKLTALEITSNSGNECVLKYDNIQDFNITEAGGSAVSKELVDDNTISFKTNPGATYIIRK